MADEETQETTEAVEEAQAEVLPGVTAEDLKVEEVEAPVADSGDGRFARMEQANADLSMKIDALTQKLTQQASPKKEEEDDYVDPDENRFNNINSKLDRVMSEFDRQKEAETARSNAQIVSAASRETGDIVEKLNAADPFLSKSPGFAQIISNQIAGAVNTIVAANPQGHNLTGQSVAAMHAELANQYKKALAGMPSQQAAEAVTQAEAGLENKGNVGGGTSPSLTDKPPVDIDSDEFWEDRARATGAAIKRMSEAQ